MKNKKGADKLISAYWFIILTLVAGGIVLMVNSFYGAPYDVRELETKILSNQVADCIYPGGKMNVGLISEQGVFKQEFGDNFLKNCELNFDSKEEFKKIQYYTEAKFYKSGDNKQLKFSLIGGNQNYLSDCLNSKLGKRVAQCREDEFWAKSPNGDIYLVKIKSIVAKVEENAK